MASEEEPKCYYSILEIANNASTCAIRNAYRKLAMKWHPDKCSGGDQADAKLKFQEIQEAYSVLSDAHKKALYDIGLYDPDDDDEDVEGLGDFISEMSGMMAEVQASEDGQGTSFEELQQLFLDMFSGDVSLAAFHDSSPQPAPFDQLDKKRSWGVVDGKFHFHDTHIYIPKTFDDSNIDANVTKKKKSTTQGSVSM